METDIEAMENWVCIKCGKKNTSMDSQWCEDFKCGWYRLMQWPLELPGLNVGVKGSSEGGKRQMGMRDKKAGREGGSLGERT
jgi:hypothetical protein